jgi:hypothetical protein
MKLSQMVAAGVATVVGLAAMAYASAMPVAYHTQETARLRLSWSARPERIEVCRQLSEAEQAERGEHMRQRVECDGTFATYALTVEVDGLTIGEAVLRGAGLRNDRPIYLLRDFPVPPGEHRVQVRVVRRETTDNDTAAVAPATISEADTGLYAGRAQREVTERGRRARAAIPAMLVLDTVFAFAPRQVALVIFNTERKVLQLHSESPR